MKRVSGVILLLLIAFIHPRFLYAQDQLSYGVVLDPPTKKIQVVIAKSPAEKAGLLQGDLITVINGAKTASLDAAAMLALLKKNDQATIDFERNGAKKTITISKAPMREFGLTCISGNCVNGDGVARLYQANLRYEGKFENGILTGRTKVYSGDGNLTYHGFLKDLLPHGNGTKYGIKENKVSYVTAEGAFKDGYLQNGSTFDKEGMTETMGEYIPGNPEKIKTGFFTLTYHNKPCYLECNDITYTSDLPVYNGKVIIREKDGTLKNGRVLCEATYINGKRNGTATEWDYDNGVYHKIAYKNGVRPSPTVIFGPDIYRIADKMMIATAITYAPEATDELAGAIVGGMFNVDAGSLKEMLFTKGVSYGMIKTYFESHREEVMAANKSGVTKYDLAPIKGAAVPSQNNTSTGGIGSGSSSASSNYASSDAASAFQKFKANISRIATASGKIHKETTYRNYRGSQASLDGYKANLKMELDNIKYYVDRLSPADKAYVRDVESDFNQNSRRMFELGLRMMYPDH